MLLDTSIIIELLAQERGSKLSDEILDITKDEKLYMSIVQIGEISDWCIRKDADISLTINTVKQIVNVIPLNNIICIKASQMKNEMRQKGMEKFGLMDGIVLASAQSINQKLLTTDSDFRMSEKVIILN